jgi:hypothetical protein
MHAGGNGGGMSSPLGVTGVCVLVCVCFERIQVLDLVFDSC